MSIQHVYDLREVGAVDAGFVDCDCLSLRGRWVGPDRLIGPEVERGRGVLQSLIDTTPPDPPHTWNPGLLKRV